MNTLPIFIVPKKLTVYFNDVVLTDNNGNSIVKHIRKSYTNVPINLNNIISYGLFEISIGEHIDEISTKATFKIYQMIFNVLTKTSDIIWTFQTGEERDECVVHFGKYITTLGR